MTELVDQFNLLRAEMSAIQTKVQQQENELNQLRNLTESSFTSILQPINREAKPQNRRQALKTLVAATLGATALSTTLGATTTTTALAQTPNPNTMGDPNATSPEPEGAPPPATPGTFYLTIPGQSFTSINSTYAFGPSTFGELLTSNGGVFQAYLELPQGAQVTELVYYFKKNVSATIFMYFNRYNSEDGTFATIGQDNTFPAPVNATIQTRPIPIPTPALALIDNPTYGYLILASLPNTTSVNLFGVRIGYTTTPVAPPVTTLNGLNGGLNLVGVGGLTVTPAGSNITLSVPANINLLPATVRVAASIGSSPPLNNPKLTSIGATPVIGNNSTQQLTVAGVGGIPATGVKGVTGVLTNVGATAGGNLRFWTAGTAPDAANLNVPAALPALNLSASFAIPVDATGKVYLGFANSIPGSQCGYVFDITGYWT
jgi:hypothetical protein